jgi:osmoprotectant transport system substrate-binding protein
VAAGLRKYRFLGTVVLLGALAASGCSSARSPAPTANVLGDDSITVASFDFPESVLLADIYAAALRRGGYDVRSARALGPRELVDPALARGLVELVPEYAGTALQFLSLGRAESSSEVATASLELRRSLDGSNLVALDPAPAQDANAIVVTPGTAARYGLRSIDDLKKVAKQLTFGGPPECPSRPLCLKGLRDVYGLRFKGFLPLDAGGPLTREALLRSQVDVALMFTTEPLIVNGGLIALTDDRRLQPAENVTPIVHRAVVKRWGPDLVSVLNRTSSRLTTEVLRRLNAQVTMGESPRRVASAWVDQESLR